MLAEIRSFTPPENSSPQWDWVRIRLERTQKSVMVPSGLRMRKLPSSTAQRDYFVIEDGILDENAVLYSEIGSVATLSGGGSLLIPRGTYLNTPAVVTYKFDRNTAFSEVHWGTVWMVKGVAEVTVQGASVYSMNAVTEVDEATHMPKLPVDCPLTFRPWYRAQLGAHYIEDFKHAATWFKLMTTSSTPPCTPIDPGRGFAFHIGTWSLGCISVGPRPWWKIWQPAPPWEEAVAKIMRCRFFGDESGREFVGKLRLVDVTP